MFRSIESLEPRRLLHAPFSAAIDFEPISADRAPGMLVDYGAAYAVRRGGLSYGWSSDVQADAVERGLAKDAKLDTFIAMPAGAEWDIAVENGAYDVYVVAGDPGASGDRVAITAEGQLAVSGVTKPGRRYVEGKINVNVSDGMLTLASAPWAAGNKICYVGIASTETTTNNTLTVDTPDTTAVEGGDIGRFRITRDGADLDDAVTIPLTLGGTATNGVDYGRFGDSVTLAAGVASVELRVRPIADSLAEGDETVTLTLGDVAGYTLVEPSATVTIQDPAPADSGGGNTGGGTTAAPTNITWSAKTSRPVAASEILGVGFGHKLYTFGGFVDSTYHPTKAAYAYDVSSNSWSKLADLPVGLTHAGVTDDGSRYVYLAGGYPGNGKNGAQSFSTTAVYRYDTQNNSYSTLPSLPAARGAGALGLVNNHLYFCAGENSGRQDVTTVWALDLSDKDDGWKQKASVPAARNHAACIGLNGKLYLIAGQTGNDADTDTHDSTYRYDPATDKWTTLASIPTARSHVSDATFVYDDKIVVLGGQSGYNAPIASDVLYDPSTNKWKTLNSLPSARFSGVGGYIGGKFVYAAGYTSKFVSTTYVGTLS